VTIFETNDTEIRLIEKGREKPQATTTPGK